MGHSQAQKSQTRQRVVEIAARRLREDGLVALSIAEVMKEAGLTHGGFYKHFPSREALLVEALNAAVSGGAYEAGRGADIDLAAIVREYLSPKHRDEPGDGCVLAAVATEAGRSPSAVKALMADDIEQKLARLQRRVPGGPHAREEAMLILSALVGAVGLARAVSDRALSDQILAGVGDRLLARLAAGARGEGGPR
ncbi:MAG: TetR/AcrR family transcriptional regulator [Caulobacteraceae bacterium]